MQGAMRTLLECIGEDLGRDGLLDTPSRYAKALLFLTKGYHANVEDIVNNTLFHEGHNEMVIMHIGYTPSNTVIGLSKLPRVAEVFSRRLQIQERLTKQVAHAVMDILRPQGVAVVMESSHLCMVMCGVEKASATTLTSCMLGCFERKSKTRNEFMHYVGVDR
ncbi:GTP cyclohydrolase I, N-terminal domain [Fusarium oxysporum f. sp. vasinfectum]|uniref:GTP cyclohydrolase 1 n=1 Tax=Fusarium oxysporum f. sp. vasinfectum 25433 TaxID=1089449 RepID=X0L290_FUSOX|nr:GTP cyclohydrolase I [Fusarium oxysporum f. sp. vasinfectum 25433]KAK2666921.1 GTP cyclohydrolase I, N-terminal domain [Fusarium oxysporum f. sp. vasinfectum]